MNDVIAISLGTIGFTAVLLCPYIINKVLKFKLEVEKMRMETELRKEEIRAKNQLDIECILAEEKTGVSKQKQAEKANRFEEYEEEPAVRERMKA